MLLQRLSKYSFLLTLLIVISLHAEESFEDDLGGFDTEEVQSEVFDELDGFEDESEELVIEEKIKEKTLFSLSGDLSFKSAYAYKNHSVKAYKSDTEAIDYSGINQAQTAIYLQVDSKLNENWKIRVSGDAFYDGIYDLKNDNTYNDDTLDAYRTQLRFDDVYIAGRLSSDLDIKIGRQIVVWGKSDSIRVTDVINPLDNRQPAMTDIEDLRLSTGMLKLDYYFGAWNLSSMIIAENRIFIEAAPRSEFFPVDNIFANAPDPFIELKKPSFSWDELQYAFALNGVFSGWDLSFYAANVLDSKWHLEGTLPNAIRTVSKIKMLGSALNVATGPWLLKSEFAYLNGIKYNSTNDEKSRLDTLIGFDYMGISDSVLSLEIVNRHIFEYEKQMSGFTQGYVPDYTEQNEVQTAIRATRSFENDSINTTLLLSMFGQKWQYGGFFRASVEYELVDSVALNFGVVDYLKPSELEKKPIMEAMSENDRIFGDITYSF